MFTIAIAAKKKFRNLKILLPILQQMYGSAEILVNDGESLMMEQRSFVTI